MLPFFLWVGNICGNRVKPVWISHKPPEVGRIMLLFCSTNTGSYWMRCLGARLFTISCKMIILIEQEICCYWGKILKGVGLWFLKCASFIWHTKYSSISMRKLACYFTSRGILWQNILSSENPCTLQRHACLPSKACVCYIRVLVYVLPPLYVRNKFLKSKDTKELRCSAERSMKDSVWRNH